MISAPHSSHERSVKGGGLALLPVGQPSYNVKGVSNMDFNAAEFAAELEEDPEFAEFVRQEQVDMCRGFARIVSGV